MYGAIHTGNLAIASLLLERGADLNVCDADGWPALFQAIATTADTRVVQWLLQRGQRAFLYYVCAPFRLCPPIPYRRRTN